MSKNQNQKPNQKKKTPPKTKPKKLPKNQLNKKPTKKTKIKKVHVLKYLGWKRQDESMELSNSSCRFRSFSLCIPSSYSLGNSYSWVFEANLFCGEVLPVRFWASHFQQAPKPPVKSLLLVGKTFLGCYEEFLEKEGARYVPATFHRDKNRNGEGASEGIISSECRDTMSANACIPGATLPGRKFPLRIKGRNAVTRSRKYLPAWSM